MFDDFDPDFESDVILDLSAQRQTISGKLVLLEDRKKKLEQVLQKLEQIKQQQLILGQSSQILQDFYTAAQKASVKRVEGFVTYCLKETFGDDAYEFKIKYETRRNQPEAELIFVRKDEAGNEQEYDPKLACGGGCLDVAVTALRLAVIMTSPQKPRRFLLIDEPFRYVSQNYRSNLIRLIEVLVEDCQTQFVIVSHFDDLKELGEVANGKLIEL
jgi:DNA repair exonuclease SbcCD ATPase subunit